jgi:hypothetical protein
MSPKILRHQVIIVRVEDNKFLERLLSVLMMQNYFCFFGEEA